MVNAVMAAVEMKSAPALTVASVPVDPMWKPTRIGHLSAQEVNQGVDQMTS